MMSEPTPEMAALARTIAEGAIRKHLGLETDDLSAGLDVAKGLIERGEFQRAMQIYLGLVLCDPLVVDFQVGLANCALLVDEAPLALQAASAVVALAPADPRGYVLSGRACLALGAFTEACEDLADAVEKAEAGHDRTLAEQARTLLSLAEGNR